MTHGFDDSGRQFDAQGNLRDWWTAEDATKYKTAAQRVVDQFNGCRGLSRPEVELENLKTNPHSPGKWRTNGPVSNMPEFKKAWGCRDGDPMVRPDSLRARGSGS